MIDIIEKLVTLDEVAESVFGISPVVARRKAAQHTLPVPAFRINSGRKGPLYVRREDIESLVNSRYEAAKAANNKMADVGLV